MSEFEVTSDERSPHLFLESGPRYVAHYEFYKDRMVMYDPVWGRCEIGPEFGDKALLDLSKNALVRRTMSIEQLTLDKYTATIPGTSEFSRWEHMWGSVAFVRKLSEDLGLDARDKLLLQLRTLVSDLGHTAYSHLGDWMFQGAGGTEDQHDQELMHLLETSGISDILRSHSISPEEVVFPDVQDWVECPSPDLCVDRVDYGAREIQRWAELSYPITRSISPEAFTIDNGRIVMRSHQDALNFAKAFLLLPTEHWSEPVHRLQLYLQEQLVKRVLTNDETGLFASHMDSPDEYYPRDYLYSFDFDITWEQLRSWDGFTTLLRTLMEDIGRYSRRNFVYQRRGQLGWLFSEFNRKPDMPMPDKPYGERVYQSLPMLPPNLELAAVDPTDDISRYNQDDRTFDVLLPPLKPRFVDPLYWESDGSGPFRLSQQDSDFKRLLGQQKQILAQPYVARLHLNPESVGMIREIISETDEKWGEALQRPRMGEQAFRRMLGETAMVAANHRLVRISVGEVDGFSLYPG